MTVKKYTIVDRDMLAISACIDTLLTDEKKLAYADVYATIGTRRYNVMVSYPEADPSPISAMVSRLSFALGCDIQVGYARLGRFTLGLALKGDVPNYAALYNAAEAAGSAYVDRLQAEAEQAEAEQAEAEQACRAICEAKAEAEQADRPDLSDRLYTLFITHRELECAREDSDHATMAKHAREAAALARLLGCNRAASTYDRDAQFAVAAFNENQAEKAAEAARDRAVRAAEAAYRAALFAEGVIVGDEDFRAELADRAVDAASRFPTSY